MSRLEDITVGSSVKGLVSNDTVEIIALKWYGTAVLSVTFRGSGGTLGSQLIYRDYENDIDIATKTLPYSFNGDGYLFRLVSEAHRIHLAHIFDPYLAVHSSEVEPLPHQISAVYHEMLSRMPLRYLLADDPGAGKTIMAGLFIKELILRGDLKRCLIVAPGSLVEQWQEELCRKFGLKFELLTNDREDSAITGNVFAEVNLCIARLDKLARNDRLQQALNATEWDLIVVDEAHKMSATVSGNEVRYTKRFNLGRMLSKITQHFLLLTATPHNGKDKDFQLFMSLIDADRFEGVKHNSNNPVDVSDVMRRLLKEELLKFDGTPLFPERRAFTVNYDLSPMEAALYDEVTGYVRGEFNRADKLEGRRRNSVGFALTILQRRLASSPEAIYQSLRRRRERLESQLKEEQSEAYSYDYPVDEDELTSSELEEMEDNLAGSASASRTIQELEREIITLKHLEDMAAKVRSSGEDRKWQELSQLIQDRSPEGQREKLIIFTEHRDTLHYLAKRIRSLVGNGKAVVTLHGGMPRDERRKVEELFRNDPEARILVATDAAGEGINLQRAHLMVNYDLPWNPNRIEQRFGRIHRIGQTEVCNLWNLVSKDTREGMVFQRLFTKLEEEREALGGKVFDILGKLSFDNAPLRELLIRAIRYGNDPGIRNRLNEAVDNSLTRQQVQKLLEEHALTQDTMDVSKVMAIHEDMERMEAHKLQPHFIEAFFVEAFRHLGGIIQQREKGRYEVVFVPPSLRQRGNLPKKYERLCFDKSYSHSPGKTSAAFITPGHPLLEAVIDLIREQNPDTLKRGAVLIDEEDSSQDARLLFTIEDAIQDGRQRIISKDIHFVELMKDGSASNAGSAPYLDYRPATQQEQELAIDYAKRQEWLSGNIEDLAVNYAVSEIIPPHFSQVRERKTATLAKISRAVKQRLTSEIQYWDFRAGELKHSEAAGKINARINSQNAARKAEELASRLHDRLEEIEREKNISPLPPVIIGCALVIPQALITSLSGATFHMGDRKAIELAAMNAVMSAEREQGHEPHDVSSRKCGYDIESFIPENLRHDTTSLRFIEVKGRAKGASTVTVSTNEIRTALNKPDEFILAIVEVCGNNPHVLYLKHPFRNAPDFTATSVNFDIAGLVRHSEVIYEI